MSEVYIEDMEQLKKAIDEEIKITVKNLSEKIHELAQDFIEQWYEDYTPTAYERTRQLLESCTLIDVKRNGVGYEAYVMLDSSKMHHANKPKNKSIGAKPFKTEEDIYRMADNPTNPMHGTNKPVKGNNGVRLWQPVVDELTDGDKLINAFGDYLESRGFNIVEVNGTSIDISDDDSYDGISF